MPFVIDVAKPLRMLVCCAGLSILGLAQAQAQTPVRVGALLSLTGANATVGEDVRRGVMLGVEHVNAKGGVLGQPMQVIVEDSGGTPTTALNAARKLVTVDKVPLVMGEYSSGITLPVGQYLVGEKVAHLNIASSSVKLRNLGPTSFGLVGLENFGNQFSAADVYALGYRNVAMIAPNNAYGQGVAHGFRQEYEALGGKISGEVLYTAGQSTYRRELQQLSQTKPDAFVYTAYGQESAVINREAHELGLRKSPWYAILLSMSLSDTAPALAEGQMGMELGSVQGELGKAYIRDFTQKYTEGFKTSYTGYGYDAVLMTAAAIQAAGSTEPAAVVAALRKLGESGFDGVTGKIRFDADGQRLDPPYDKLKYEGGKIVPR